jgi:hypothetical protein
MIGDTVTDEPEQPPSGPVMRPDGVIEGKPSSASLAVEPEPAGDAPLELAERKRTASAPSRHVLRLVPQRVPHWRLALVVVPLISAVGIVAGVMLSRHSTAHLPAFVVEAAPILAGPPVVIDSVPGGATIHGPNGVIGQTPWAGNNPFLIDTTITLKAKGHRPRRIVIPGAKETTVRVVLTRSPDAAPE